MLVLTPIIKAYRAPYVGSLFIKAQCRRPLPYQVFILFISKSPIYSTVNFEYLQNITGIRGELIDTMAEKAATFSEPSYAKSDKAKIDYPWYSPNIDKYLVPEVCKNELRATIITRLTAIIFPCRRKNC